MTHKYAPILNAIMEGKTIQHLQPDQSYINLSEDMVLWHLGQYGSGYNLRVKPDTLDIAGIAVVKPMTEKPMTEKPMTEKPMTEKPELGQMYFYIVPWLADGGIGEDCWADSETDNHSLHNGMCWLTREHAVNAAAAIKKLLMGG